MEAADIVSVVQQWESLDSEFKGLEGLHKTYSKSMDEMRKDRSQCQKVVTNHLQRFQQVSNAVQKCKFKTQEEKTIASVLKQKMEKRKVQLDDIQSTLPKNNGVYLNIILGHVNVTIANKEESMKYKEEYERFKLTVTIIILILSLQSILLSYRFLDALLHFLLVWYYCTLTIRESILVVNGTRMKGWWRIHHFITTIQAGVIIVWPDGIMYDQFRLQFTLYLCYTSILQFLQFRYQQGCLYRLRALGVRYKMDITIEGFHSWMWRGLGFLLPFLYFGYGFQMFNAYTLYKLSIRPECVEWQVFLSSVIFFTLFFGNTLTTTWVLWQKVSSNFNDKTNAE